MQVAIFGGGFGLYGYLPAALELNLEVHTLEKYRGFIESRRELKPYFHRISWHQIEAELIESSECVVIARTPGMQEEILSRLSSENQFVFLEKPLTESVKTHRSTLKFLDSSHFEYQINYLFLYCDWFSSIQNMILKGQDMRIQIDWKIVRPTVPWKNNEFMGGGLFNYYGIHFLPLIYSFGFHESQASFKYSDEKIEIICGNANLKVDMSVSFSDYSGFYVKTGESPSDFRWSGSSPFGKLPQAGIIDPRVPLLSQYIRDVLTGNCRVNYPKLENFVCSLREKYPLQSV